MWVPVAEGRTSVTEVNILAPPWQFSSSSQPPYCANRPCKQLGRACVHVCMCVRASHTYIVFICRKKSCGWSIFRCKKRRRKQHDKSDEKLEIVRQKHRRLCLSYPLLIGVSHFNPMTSSPLKPPITSPHHPLPSHPTPFIPRSQHPSALHSILVQTLLSAAGTKHRWIMAVKCHHFFMAAASSPHSPPGPSPKLTINQLAEHLNMEQWRERGRGWKAE